MKKIATFTLLALILPLAACNSPAGYANRSLESIHQPVVSSSTHHLDLAAYGGDISSSEAGRLQGWLEALGVRYGDQVTVQDGSAYGSPTALATIRRLLAKQGAVLSGVSEDAAATVGQGNLRLTITRSSAQVPGCPDWSTRYQADPYNSTSANYGCATNSNLAAMVADPNDLIRGAKTGDDNAQHGVKAVKTYREKALTGAKELKENATSSESGQ